MPDWTSAGTCMDRCEGESRREWTLRNGRQRDIRRREEADVFLHCLLQSVLLPWGRAPSSTSLHPGGAERLVNLPHVTQLVEAELRSQPRHQAPTTRLWLLSQICHGRCFGPGSSGDLASFTPQLTFEEDFVIKSSSLCQSETLPDPPKLLQCSSTGFHHQISPCG